MQYKVQPSLKSRSASAQGSYITRADTAHHLTKTLPNSYSACSATCSGNRLLYLAVGGEVRRDAALCASRTKGKGFPYATTSMRVCFTEKSVHTPRYLCVRRGGWCGNAMLHTARAFCPVTFRGGSADSAYSTRCQQAATARRQFLRAVLVRFALATATWPESALVRPL